ncbi:hypothetical protein [Wolbachia endosymbiont of Frankliniella intonsa]|nr:hypothetical protein [Wolbachia endosymbiont of Frankliniella intonsa]WGJ62038.1 hypothetical protein M3L71_07350 [Wolbachia endosymbiont of Frankliniella intonsa]
MPFIPRYFTYSSMTFSPLFSICSFYSGNWYNTAAGNPSASVTIFRQ